MSEPLYEALLEMSERMRSFEERAERTASGSGSLSARRVFTANAGSKCCLKRGPPRSIRRLRPSRWATAISSNLMRSCSPRRGAGETRCSRLRRPARCYLRALSDCRAIIGKAGGGERVALVGASFIAMEVAAALIQRNLRFMPSRRKRFRWKTLGPQVGQ